MSDQKNNAEKELRTALAAALQRGDQLAHQLRARDVERDMALRLLRELRDITEQRDVIVAKAIAAKSIAYAFLVGVREVQR